MRMLQSLDPIFLSRIQFAFVVAFHIIFPAFTIGLASWLAVLEGIWLKTKNPLYKELYLHWVKIFAIAFGMGVVSGVVMSYQFGTNWAIFAHKTANVLGPLFAYEVLTAFFLEASFLGIMLFGWNRVGPKLHFLSTLLVAIGTLVSTFWILSANSWMQTPAGFTVDTEGVFFPSDWLQVIFNPSFIYRLLHMVLATFLTTAFVVAGVASWNLLRNKNVAHARIALAMAMIIAIFLPPLQVAVGHASGVNTYKHQPVKLAAMEGLFKTKTGADLHLLGWPNKDTGETEYAVVIPKGLSTVLTGDPNATIKGLEEWPRENWPPITPVFVAFRIMVGAGILMAITGITAIILILRKKLFTSKLFHRWCVLLTPIGFIAILAGWITTEVGRQPFVVYNQLRTVDAASAISQTQVTISLLMFMVVYTFVFGSGLYYMCKLFKQGISGTESNQEIYGSHGLKDPTEALK